MHCTLGILAQTGRRPEVYAIALWAMVVLLTALLLAFLLMRLLRLWWARSDARAAAVHRNDVDATDAWTESARRMSVEADADRDDDDDDEDDDEDEDDDDDEYREDDEYEPGR